ncbi:MAG: DUF4491 family protein [Alistipes sp.]|nr:DUF4491 family protein [Alistipes sp.]
MFLKYRQRNAQQHYVVIGCSCLWSIRELFEQRECVRKGWFP